LFTKVKYAYPWRYVEDYEVDDLTDEDIDYINRMLNEQYQQELTSVFEDYGHSCMEVYYF